MNCMKNDFLASDKIFCFCPGQKQFCLSRSSGKIDQKINKDHESVQLEAADSQHLMNVINQSANPNWSNKNTLINWKTNTEKSLKIH